jgi:epoxyqueuosine reductase
MELKERLRTRALEEGFVGFGICRTDAVPGTAERLRAFLAEGRHGQMGWMAEREEWRGKPPALWPEARSVIMLADYHDLVKRRLKRLGRWLIDQAGGEIKVFVDTAPVMEKPLAQAAGLGWQGKHTNLLGRDLGNWVFLGAIFTTLDLEPDAAEVSHCGSCTACLDICPTRAFPAPYQLDARRCISYLTIEHKGPVDTELRACIGNRIYGCDDCLAVCPWNKFAVAAKEIGYQPKHGLPELAELAMLDDATFRERFAGSPIKRIGRDRFVRNVLYAIGNSGLPALRPVAAGLMGDPDPAVADAARWAVARLG